MKSGFRIVKKALEKQGFVIVKDGNHVIFSKQGHTVCVTKNVRNPQGLIKKALKQWKNELTRAKQTV